MNMIDRILSRLGYEKGAATSDQIRASSVWDDLANTSIASGSSSVNEVTAMQSSAVYACVNLIGGAIASMPAHIYKRLTDRRERADSPLWWLLNEQPSPDISAATMWEYAITSLLLQGDAFIRILRRSAYNSEIIGLEPWAPSRVNVKRVDGRLVYVLTPIVGDMFAVDQADMIHIPGPGFNGFRGMSQIKYTLRNPAGIALAADNYSKDFFDNSARPDFVLSTTGNLTEKQIELLRNSWEDRYGGQGNHHKPAILFGGLDVKQLSMNSEDAQLLGTRQFQIEDIARVFGVPPFMIGHTEKTTSWGSGVEQMAIGFVKFTLTRHLKKIEQEVNRKFWPTREKYFVEFLTAGLERGDYKSRNEGYRIALGRAGEPGWMTINEVRAIENLPPDPDGNKLNGQATATPPNNGAQQ